MQAKSQIEAIVWRFPGLFYYISTIVFVGGVWLARGGIEIEKTNRDLVTELKFSSEGFFPYRAYSHAIACNKRRKFPRDSEWIYLLILTLTHSISIKKKSIFFLQLGLFPSRWRPITCLSLGRGRFAWNHGPRVSTVFWFVFLEWERSHSERKTLWTDWKRG